jgi:pyruvate formate lyase activating enzyme
MTFCPAHKKCERIAANVLVHCGSCISEHETYVQQALSRHREIRQLDGLVPSIPSIGNIVCPDCGNHCRLREGDAGFCHLRAAHNGKIEERYPGKAVVSWYFDPLPTNCVADWACSLMRDKKLGFGRNRLNNLAVFYGSCNSDCLFCQNCSFRHMMVEGNPLMTPRELANAADDRTACVCYFGGDPACNSAHSLQTSRLLYDERDVRVCYETNGNISRKWLDKIADIVIGSAGTLKFDIKAITPNLYTALTGISNAIVLRNFERLALRGIGRSSEFLVASVLLVPGYVGVDETRKICEFIEQCDPTIPTALLGFFPHHKMWDLPRTSRAHAENALQTARDAGLTNVRIGNVGLLSNDNYRFD